MTFHQRAVERIRTHLAVGAPGSTGQNADAGQWSLLVVHHARQEKRRGYSLWMEEVSGQRQNAENREPAANRGFSVAARIPGKAESRLENEGGWFGVKRRGHPGAARPYRYRGNGRNRRPALRQRVAE